MRLCSPVNMFPERRVSVKFVIRLHPTPRSRIRGILPLCPACNLFVSYLFVFTDQWRSLSRDSSLADSKPRSLFLCFYLFVISYELIYGTHDI
jgi:glucose-6-phosphate-specific signal transduction histidine kinase